MRLPSEAVHCTSQPIPTAGVFRDPPNLHYRTSNDDNSEMTRSLIIKLYMWEVISIDLVPFLMSPERFGRSLADFELPTFFYINKSRIVIVMGRRPLTRSS